ncbi:MAG TPA: hypothetical protein VLX31_00780 [Streptosporangiaceae bacterium]|nr:hypothetical protein [Streptosporangiaceae bacterium]
MTTSIAAFRARRTLYRKPPALRELRTAGENERAARRTVAVAYGLLFLNALGYTGSAIHVPSIVGKAITQGALPAALVLLLSVNRRVILRPNVFLCLVSLLSAEAFLTALQPQYFGTIYRTFRLAEFVIALWLLTPWWGRTDRLLLRCHMIILWVILGTVALGLLVAPGQAIVAGRLGGSLWYIPTTQVAHYAAVLTGLMIVLWLCGEAGGRRTLATVFCAIPLLLLTHTRTALAGMAAGILVAGMSLVVARARVRKLFAAAGILLTLGVLTLSGFITTWLARGEGSHELTDLTGRTKVWTQLLATPRNAFQEIFGFGLSNSSYNGLPIDSTWVSSYQEQGLFGDTVCGLILLFLLVAAYFQLRGVQRAVALFLIVYCLIASFTEDGFNDVTPYLLDLTIAASMLLPAAAARYRHESRAGPIMLPTCDT